MAKQTGQDLQRVLVTFNPNQTSSIVYLKHEPRKIAELGLFLVHSYKPRSGCETSFYGHNQGAGIIFNTYGGGNWPEAIIGGTRSSVQTARESLEGEFGKPESVRENI